MRATWQDVDASARLVLVPIRVEEVCGQTKTCLDSVAGFWQDGSEAVTDVLETAYEAGRRRDCRVPARWLRARWIVYT